MEQTDTVRVVRLLVYEGPRETVDRQLALSLSDGWRMGHRTVKISALTLNPAEAAALLDYQDAAEPSASLEEKLAQLAPAPYTGVQMSPEEILPERQSIGGNPRALKAIVDFVTKLQLTPGERYLLAIDKALLSEQQARELAYTLRHEGIRALIARTTGDPRAAIQMIALPEA